MKDIRRMTPREFSVEEKIRFVLEGCVATRASLSSAEVRASSKSLVSVVEGDSRSWQEATRRRPVRAATSDEVKDLNRGGLGEWPHRHGTYPWRNLPSDLAPVLSLWVPHRGIVAVATRRLYPGVSNRQVTALAAPHPSVPPRLRAPRSLC